MQPSSTTIPREQPEPTIKVMICATGGRLSVHPEMKDIRSALGAIGRESPPADLRRRIMCACDEAAPIEEIDCHECLELASAYLDDELTDAERDAFEAHAFACEPCYVVFKQMERTAEVLRDVPPATAPSDLYDRITAAVGREEGVQSVFTWRRTAKVLGGLAAAAALLAAIFVPRGGDGVDAPVVAEAPREVVAGVTDEPGIVAEPADPIADTGEAGEVDAVAEPAEPAEMNRGAETQVAAAPTPAAPAPRARSASAPSPVTTPEAPERAPDVVRESPAETRIAPESGQQVRAPEPQPRPARPERPAQTPSREAAEPAIPDPAPVQPEPEPVIAEEPRTPAPEHANTPTVTAEPPALQPRPRETAVAAAPRAPAPEPVPVTVSSPAPAATAAAPRPGADAETTRAAVVPRQPRARAVYHPEPTPPAERSEKLARIAEGINGAQTPRLDNPPSGIELN